MVDLEQELFTCRREVQRLEAAWDEKSDLICERDYELTVKDKRIAELEALIPSAQRGGPQGKPSSPWYEKTIEQGVRIAELEARNEEVKRALPEWCQGPGIVGAVLHMVEHIAELEEAAKLGLIALDHAYQRSYDEGWNDEAKIVRKALGTEEKT